MGWLIIVLEFSPGQTLLRWKECPDYFLHVEASSLTLNKIIEIATKWFGYLNYPIQKMSGIFSTGLKHALLMNHTISSHSSKSKPISYHRGFHRCP